MTAHDPAYPCETRQFTPAGYDRHPGLTKRELYAAMAMQGQIGEPKFAEAIARRAVIYADALLAELAKDGAP